MRILMVTETFAVGGTERAIVTLTKGLRQAGHEVKILAPNSSPFRGITTIAYSDVSKIGSLILKWKPDVFHFHSPGPLSIFLLAYAKLLGKPTIAHFHSLPEAIKDKLPVERPIVKKIIKSFMKNFYSKADATIVPSRALAASLRKAGWKNVVAIPYGTETTKLKPPEPKKKISLLFVGQFRKDKNLEFLLHVLRRLPENFHLTLVGDGPQCSHLKSLTVKLNISDRVHFPGPVPPEATEKIYGRHSIYVNASRSETFGLSMAEALATGLPVVAVPSFGSRGLIQNGKNGFIASTPASFSHAVLLATKKFKQLSQQAKLSARRFSVSNFVNRTMALYKKAKSTNHEISLTPFELRKTWRKILESFS